MEILKYIKNNEDANFFRMVEDLQVYSDDLAKELTFLIDKKCVNVYEGGFYSLTPEGLKELEQLKGKK